MADANNTIPAAILKKALQESGFPFQTAVAHVIRSSKGWRIHASEYPWRGIENNDCFLDIVAANNRFVLTVECKKTKANWIFLRPHDPNRASGDTAEFRCLCVYEYRENIGRLVVRCENWNLWPRSPSCEFCVVGSPTAGGQRMLERDAALLIGATDAFAKDIQESRLVTQKLPFPYPVVPVIVTNAKMYSALYNPSEISLESGESGWPKEKIESDIPWIRFHKTFIAGRGRDVGARSIYVVNSMHFKEFLENLEPAPDQPKDKVSVYLA